ncbi:MAG: cytochrome o ubiquinol oxidase subunit I [Alphaproteobacteria bacterium]|nr:cytochrome o ubiquinol oxidase subunit I [Alphaproteobacteria bacterium]
MFGRLTLHDLIPHDMIVGGAVAGMVLGGLLVAGLITYFKKWPYLWKEWLTTVDHKKIGIMYVVVAMIMLLRGFADAIMLRTHQAMALAEPGIENPESVGYLTPDHFNQIYSAHGMIMIIFVAMPFLSGLMNLIVPLQIGARDVAFPLLNAVSFWLTSAGAALVMVSLAIGEFSTAGWSGYPPLTDSEFSPGVGVDYWVWAFQVSGAGTLMTGINFIATIMKMRAPGMNFMKMPLFTWNALFTSVIIIFAFPVLTIALALTSLDRYVDTHFYTNDGGGNMMMFINLFWIWGHPEVYIVILPAFGIFSEVVANFSRKKLFGYTSLVWATAAIAFLSFTVWLHHFFTMGAGPSVNAFFGIATMLIGIPTGVKIFNWLFTMYKGRVEFTVPMLWTIGFLIAFVIGGTTGILLSVPPANYVIHNSVFLVAHFHNMLIPGALFGLLAGYSYWFPKAFGFRLHEGLGKAAFWCWFIGFFVAFMPLYKLGTMGMPRRLQHYTDPAWEPYLMIAAIGTGIIALGTFFLIAQLAYSIRKREELADETGDPWDGRTLEWSTSSPPPVYNFARIPHIHNLDAWIDMKDRGVAWKKPDRYHDIVMPRNTPVGLFAGGIAFVLCFALTWHIWWLVVASLLGIAALVVIRSFDEHTTFTITAAEIEKVETDHLRKAQAALAARNKG